VTAVDWVASFLSQLDASAAGAGLQGHIETVEGSIAELAYPNESFDLLWSEGAIYNLGFSEGLALWRPLLRPGCALVVSELVWLSDTPTETIRRFWDAEYPGMQNLQANEKSIAEAGYSLLGSFEIPKHEWWDDYYTPIDCDESDTASKTTVRSRGTSNPWTRRPVVVTILGG
jgi:hypothetical protein